MSINLFHGDCLEVMADMPDNSVDAVICDPPYGTTACKWDAVIPFEPMWRELRRLIKPGGAIVLFGSEPFSSALRMSNIREYKYDWVWDKGVGVNFMHVKKEPMKVHEMVTVFASGKTNYYPQKTARDKPIRKSNNIAGESSGYKLSDSKYVGKVYHDKYPESIVEYSSRARDGRGLHPTQKPVALLEYLIRTYTNEGETVLDFTMGSGTTGVACVNTGRNFVGIEKDAEYFRIAQYRIRESVSERKGQLL